MSLSDEERSESVAANPAPASLTSSEPPPSAAVSDAQQDARNETADDDGQSFSLESLQELLRNESLLSSLDFLRRHAIHMTVGLIAFFFAGGETIRHFITVIFVQPILWMVSHTIGTALGIGLGLGLATHVYDRLTSLQERQDRDGNLKHSRSSNGIQRQGLAVPTTLLTSTSSAVTNVSSVMDHNLEQTYASLMQTAGYHVEGNLLRGQVLRKDHAAWTQLYNYTEGKFGKAKGSGWPQSDRALRLLQKFFPVMPTVVLQELALLIELVIRDYIAVWYSMIDAGCNYQSSQVSEEDKQENPTVTSHESPSQKRQAQFTRRMMYSLATHRSIPFLDNLYESFCILFGNLATRVEHVNILQLALLQWTRVLAHTFRVYRSLRKSVVLKQQAHQHQQKQKYQRSRSSFQGEAADLVNSLTSSTPKAVVAPSEMAMTKEFLLTGKLHKAVTFGLDVPSLLFADGSGKECGLPDEGSVMELDDDAILEKRLFQSSLISECEQDYLRLLSHRMVRALVTRQDFGSPMLASLLTELLATCALAPLMTIFCPEYLNSWIIKGLGSSEEDDPEATNNEGKQEGVQTSQSSSPNVGNSETGNQQSSSIDLDSSNAVRRQSGTGERHASSGPDGIETQSTRPDDVGPLSNITAADNIVTLLADSLIKLQDYVDFEDFRESPAKTSSSIDWDNPGCRAAILRLALIIEAVFTHGRCTYRCEKTNIGVGSDSEIANEVVEEEDQDIGEVEYDEDLEDREGALELTLPEYESTMLVQVLMEMTSDIEAFEERVASEKAAFAANEGILQDRYSDENAEECLPSKEEQSTVRTLIAAWLHSGQVHRYVGLLVDAHMTILAPFYHSGAFLRTPSNANGFVRQLKALDGIEIVVDTMTILTSPRLDRLNQANADALLLQSASPISAKSSSSSPAANVDHTGEAAGFNSEDFEASPSVLAPQFNMSSSSTPRYLDFHRNEAFAASLRSERERRLQSWYRIAHEEIETEEGLPIVYRSKGQTDADRSIHRELHTLARIFYSGTNLIAIRDAARRKNSEGASSSDASDASESIQVSLLTVETASQRRRIEIPDDDSSFLLRAQPRSVSAVGVHRDQHNHDQSFKRYAATYEEPALNASSEHYSGGKYVRRCLLRYYPIDRTATVELQSGAVKKMDQRKGRSAIPDTITVGQSSRAAPFLSSEFLRERHLCQRWVPRGTSRSQSMLSSSVMEPTDFNSSPRTGKAIDFVYKMSFFERPMVDLSGKHFTVHDSPSLGSHRADASSLEISDASLSAALLLVGASAGEKKEESLQPYKNSVEMGPDGYPIIYMKFSAKGEAQAEVKPFRTSFVRAALLVTGARQEAQLQSLIACVKAGSAKRATKALTDLRLKPTIRLLDYAGNRSREKQSVLLRDLKLGVNHIDRGQLRRNALLSPRYPTLLRQLTVTVEGSVTPEDGQGIDLFGGPVTLYKIRCFAVADIIAEDYELSGEPGYMAEDGTICGMVQEEWVVYRSFKDFQQLHKHLKQQVSASESSGTASSRLVGAATAAFAAANNVPGRPQRRQALIPSLSQASKSGALGVMKASTAKRQEALDGYLKYLFERENLLNRCSELLLFVGAAFPLPREVRPGRIVSDVADPLGRTEMKRALIIRASRSQRKESAKSEANNDSTREESRKARSLSTVSIVSAESQDEDDEIDKPDDLKKIRKVNMLPAIRNKITKVHLSHVRNRIFELLHYLFGFDNASFIRNRMLSAIKTVSFAVTTNSEFQRMLYKLHLEQISASAIGGWINFAICLLWPDGVFFESSPPTPIEQLQADSKRARDVLHKSFPEQLRSILGQDLTSDGLDIFHEMLQNRLVMKSLFYILFDMLWLEVFPEIGDILECGASLDLNET